MSFLHSALTLPTYGEAFKLSKTASVVDNAIDGSASPPHKRIRLDPDSDDAPSRTRTTTSGPVKLQLVGAPPGRDTTTFILTPVTKPLVVDKGLQHGQLQSKEVAAWVRGLLLPEPEIRATNELWHIAQDLGMLFIAPRPYYSTPRKAKIILMR